MNDAWDPTEDLEPLDDDSQSLLASYRDASGPSEDAQARMLAGLRARVRAEDSANKPTIAAPAEGPTAPRERRVSSNTRTFSVAAIAFAAGVALTVSLGGPRGPQQSDPIHSGGAEQVVRHEATDLGPARTETFEPAGHASAAPLSVPNVVEPMADRPWPLSVADLAKPYATVPDGQRAPQAVDEVQPARAPTPRAVALGVDGEGSDDTSPAAGRSGADDGPQRNDRWEGAAASRDPLQGSPGPSSTGRGTAIRGAWAPSVNSAPGGAGVGSAARNPAVADPSPAVPDSGPSPSDTGADGSSETPSDEPPPADDPPHSDEAEEESEDEQGEDEPPLEEFCSDEYAACMADAERFCQAYDPACIEVFEFCDMRNMLCMGEEDGFPPPESPLPDPDHDADPDPEECEVLFGMCEMEADAFCEEDEMLHEDCEHMHWMCEDERAMCYGEPPPEPWW
ncbi:MAG: hypothetical protein ACRBN8_10955 [Nannocystales bacterium]